MENKKAQADNQPIIQDLLFNVNSNDLIQEDIRLFKSYIINMDFEVFESNYYRKVYDCLRKAEKDSEVRLILNTVGGDLSTFIQLYNLLQKCEAKTIAEVYTAYSCGAFLMLSCDEIEINEFSSVMIHSMSYANEGKLEEVTASNDFMRKWNSELTHKLLCGFMTQQEIKDVNNGKDFWFMGDEVKKRLKKWIPIRKRKEER